MSWWTEVSHWVDHWWPSVRTGLYNWQTMIAGLLALAAALATIRLIRRQINQVTDLEQERRAREEAAARAILPLALSELTEYASDCIKLLVQYVPADGPIPNVPADYKIPRIPENAIVTLQTCARFADENIVAQFANLLGKLQIQHARLRDLFSRSVQRQRMFNVEGIGALIDAADIQARAGTLFDYARNDAQLRQLAPAQQLINSLHTSGVWEHPALFAEIERRQQAAGEGA